MKVGILAGGLGTRFSEETQVRPKPMIEIGGMPIIWHIMNIYAHYGFKEFVVALGYKGEYIKKYMTDYCSLNNDLSIDMASGEVKAHDGQKVDWKIDLIDTGKNTNTGGRIKRLAPYLGNSTCMVTWGDGVSDINIKKLLAFHKEHGRLATLTAVHPTARFGHVEMDGNKIIEFSEKPQTTDGWVNGAYFVFEPGVFDYIDKDNTLFEKQPLENLAKDGQLMAYKHNSFWQCMDTLRDKVLLEKLWKNGNPPPWKIW